MFFKIWKILNFSYIYIGFNGNVLPIWYAEVMSIEKEHFLMKSSSMQNKLLMIEGFQAKVWNYFSPSWNPTKASQGNCVNCKNPQRPQKMLEGERQSTFWVNKRTSGNWQLWRKTSLLTQDIGSQAQASQTRNLLPAAEYNSESLPLTTCPFIT